METSFPGWWVGPGDDEGLDRKLGACERITELALTFAKRDLPIRQPKVSAARPDGSAMPVAVFDEFGRGVKTFRACVQLASTGYGQQALMLAGVVLQSSLMVMWAVEQDESVDRKADLHMRYSRQVVLEMRRDAGWGKGLPSTDYLSDEEREEAYSLFGQDSIGLWTGHSSLTALIDDLESYAEDEFTRAQSRGLKVMAATADGFLAGTGWASKSHRVATSLPDGTEAISVNVGPDVNSCSDALHMASAGMLSALDSMVSQYAPDLAEDVRRCEAFMWRAWKEPQELTGLADTDPCPCDRPDTLWGECHKWTESLGTVQYVPFTDADLVNFTPYDPSSQEPLELNPRTDPIPDVPEGPVVLTFTFKLPFTLGLHDGGCHDHVVHGSWVDPDDVAHFGKAPRVRLRLHNQPTDGFELWPANAADALRGFYGDFEDPPSPEKFEPIPGAYEQWVTLETPCGRLDSEPEEDGGYAFHRCLSVLNGFLLALELAETDNRISSVSTHEIGPVVFRGAILKDGTWTRLGDLLMHVESFPFPLQPQSFEAIERQIKNAMSGLWYGRPFLIASLWTSRALRAANVRGDNPDAVVSIQTAAESLMYDLLSSILVDLGKTSSEITARVSADLPFRSLLTREIPSRLGGDWSLSGDGPVAKYWKAVYLLRNRVVHAGYSPTNPETRLALRTYLEVREYVSKLLWKRCVTYPRTLLAKVGENGLVRRGWMSAGMLARCEQFKNEPKPFYLPRDIAGRQS